MDQRESLQLPASLTGQTFGQNGKMTLAALLGHFFIQQNLTDMPIIFLDRAQINGAIQQAIEYAKKMDTNPTRESELVQKLGLLDSIEALGDPMENNLSDMVARYTITSMQRVVMCLLCFKDSQNALCVVGGGNSGNYYVIDVNNRIFCVTTCPEYDIPNYASRFGGNGDVTATMWIKKNATPVLPKKQKEEEVEVVKVPALKRKKTVKKTVPEEPVVVQ